LQLTRDTNRSQGLVGHLAGALLIACAAIALAGCGGTSAPKAASTTTPAAVVGGAGLHGMVPDPMPAKPAFTLTDTAGRPFAFAPATSGKLTYLFFGYTHCPDVCPATMSFLSAAIRQQPAALQRKIAVVFVTVDPTRDTGPVIRRWLDHYSRSFVGVRGSDAQIAAVERQAGIPVAPPAKKSPSATYTLAHSSFLMAYSPDGRAHVVYVSGFKETDYAHDIPLLLKYT
jgi:protein SCO1/2